MANEQNLENGKATQFKSGEEAAESGRNGGIASGRAKREKASLRKAAQEVLNGEYTDKSGKKLLGANVVILNLFKIAADPHNKQCIQAVRLLMELYNEDKSPAEMEKLRAEIALLKAKTEVIHGAEQDFEDLTTLADMLRLPGEVTNNEPNADD